MALVTTVYKEQAQVLLNTGIVDDKVVTKTISLPALSTTTDANTNTKIDAIATLLEPCLAYPIYVTRRITTTNITEEE